MAGGAMFPNNHHRCRRHLLCFEWTLVCCCCCCYPLLDPTVVISFIIRPDSVLKPPKCNFQKQSNLPPLRLSSFDYEFLPYDDNDDDDSTPSVTSSSSSSWNNNLPSSYPPHTPAGLRGEAVRSALLSDSRCVAWQHQSSGLIQLQGRGVVDFLQAKLTKSFSLDVAMRKSSTSFGDSVVVPSSSYFTKACLLNSKGHVVDGLSVAVITEGRQDDSTTEDSPRSSVRTNQPRSTTAWWLTSMRHDCRPLVEQLDAMIFPMDQVQVKHINASILTLASTQWSVVQETIQNQVLPFFNMDLKSSFIFPNHDQCGCYEIPPSANDVDREQSLRLLVLPTTGLPSCFCVGYTICCFRCDVGQQLWQHLTGDANTQGPIDVGPLEYESLRVQAGQPAYGYEYRASLLLRRPLNKNKESTTSDGAASSDDEQQPSSLIPPSPLELHMVDEYLDLNTKDGCYLGQEGLSSMLKNPRGPPRTLYQVVFDDDSNVYDETPMQQQQQQRRRSHRDNLTKYPHVRDKLYVLGSNEQIWVGTITSVAEPNGSGEANTVALCLVRRADSVVSSMKAMDLEMDQLMELEGDDGTGYIVPPPPMDPLHGLEVIVGGTFTIGRLRSIPSRRVGPGQNWLVSEFRKSRSRLSSNSRNKNVDDDDDLGFVNIQRTRPRFDNAELLEQMKRMAMASTPVTAKNNIVDIKSEVMESSSNIAPSLKIEEEEEEEQDNYQLILEEAEKAQKEAEAAAAEAKRKAEKMELLKKRAEEAMARRKGKPHSSSQPSTS